MKDQVAVLSQSLSSSRRAASTRRIEQRGAIAALSRAGLPTGVIAAFTQTHPRTVRRWITRVEQGQELTDRPRCGRPRIYGEALRLTTIALYCQQVPPLPGIYRWSLRDAEGYFRQHPYVVGAALSRATIQRILIEHALRPHRRRYYLQITDPDFFAKMQAIVQLYRRPPEHLYCFDECTFIQARKRSTPNLPPRSAQPRLEDFDYQRNGTTDLLAFLDPATGQVCGHCTPNHNRHTFGSVFTAHVQSHPPEAVIHYIMDNLATHYHDDFCTRVAQLCGVPYSPLALASERRQWLESEHKRIVVHFLPFHASWLNLIEIWFGILKRKCLGYDHFACVDGLRDSILAFIQTWNEAFAHPFRWSYTGEDLYAKAVRRFTRLLALETDQMDSAFLKNQLLLMCNIASLYLERIPSADWLQLLQLATEKLPYMTRIIDNETGPIRKKTAQQAYERFRSTVLNRQQPLARAS